MSQPNDPKVLAEVLEMFDELKKKKDDDDNSKINFDLLTTKEPPSPEAKVSYSKSPNEDNLTKQAELIRAFNDVYALSKSALDILTDLNTRGKSLFSISTAPSSPPDYFCFISTITLNEIITFTSAAATSEADSRDDVVRQAFNYLKSLSKLMTTFLTIHNITHEPVTIMRELINKHGELIQARTEPHTSGDGTHHTTVQAVGLGLFFKRSVTPKDSERSVYEEAVEYLKRLAFCVFGVPKDFNPLPQQQRSSPAAVKKRILKTAEVPAADSFERFVFDPKTPAVRCGISVHSVGTSPIPGQSTKRSVPGVSMLRGSTFLNRVAVMRNFDMVYDATKTPPVLFNDFLKLYPTTESPPLLLETVYNTHQETYQSTVRIEHLATLTSTELTELESKRQAQLKAYKFLKDFRNLLKMVPAIEATKRAAVDQLESLTRHRTYLIKMSTRRERTNRYLVTINLINFQSFIGVGSHELEAKEAAARNVMEYLKSFVEAM